MAHTEKEKPVISQAITLARLPLTAGVVMIHCYLTSTDITASDWGAWVATLLSMVMSQCAVPVFFFISGLLFFKGAGFDMPIYKRKLRSRVRTLLVPFLIWNTLYFFWLTRDWLFSYGLSPYDICACYVHSFLDYNPTPSAYFMPTSVPLNYPTWYVRELLVLCVATPLIFFMLRRKSIGTWLLLLLTALYIAGWWPHTPVLCVTSVLFFMLGAYAAIHKAGVAAVLSRFSPSFWLIVLLAPLDTYLFLTQGDWNIHSHAVLILCLTPAAFFAFTSLAGKAADSPVAKVCETLAPTSTFVFFSHVFFLNEYRILLQALEPTTSAMLVSKQLLLFALTFATPLAVYILMQRCTPRLLALLTGGRSKN